METSNMATEKETSQEEITKDSPYFKIELDKNNNNHIMLFYVMITAGIVVALYVASILLRNHILTLISFILALIFVFLLFAIYKIIHKTERIFTEDEIDENVEKYKNDLIETFNGYNIAYTAKDILDAADVYRERLEEENTSIVDIDPKNIGAVLKLMIQDSKTVREQKKKAKEKIKASK